MADPTVTQVFADAAALLGDVAQEQFTSAVLLPWYGFAFRELFDVLQRWRLPLGERTGYGIVPAFTNMFIPERAGIADFGQPISIMERGNLIVATVLGVSDTTPVVVTTSGLMSWSMAWPGAAGTWDAIPDTWETIGDTWDTAGGVMGGGGIVEISGVVGPVGINDQWFISILSPTTFSLNGSYAGGAWVSGGTIVLSSGEFMPMQLTDSFPQIGPADTLGHFKWQNNRLYFAGANNPRELMLNYTSDGNAPISGSVGIENSRNHLAVRTASLVAGQYDMPQSAKQWTLEALGPSMTADGTGGTLRNLVGPMLLAKQLTVKRAGTFRPRRNRFTGVLW